MYLVLDRPFTVSIKTENPRKLANEILIHHPHLQPSHGHEGLSSYRCALINRRIDGEFSSSGFQKYSNFDYLIMVTGIRDNIHYSASHYGIQLDDDVKLNFMSRRTGRAKINIEELDNYINFLLASSMESDWGDLGKMVSYKPNKDYSELIKDMLK